MDSGSDTFMRPLVVRTRTSPAREPTRRGRDAWIGIQEVEGGFPHSEILGSKLVRSSPRLIAAYHVLHRLSAPRHPPDTLIALDCSHYRCPPSRAPRQRRVRRVPRLATRDRTRLSKTSYC